MVLQQNKNAGANCPCIFYSAAESIFSIKMPILGTPQNRAFCGEEEAAGLKRFHFAKPAKGIAMAGRRRAVGSLIKTWVTAPMSLPFWRMGSPLICVSIWEQEINHRTVP